MVLLGYAQGVASTAGSYAFSAASSYVFRTDASTSTAPPLPNGTSSTSHKSGSPPSSASSRRLSIRRSPSQSRLPSASPPYLNGIFSPSSSSTAVNGAIPESDEGDRPPRGEAEDLVDELNREDELYTILGVGKRAKTEEIRRAFLARSRIIHPDKLPFYPPSTTAFQRLSYAYETLSKPSSRRLYDLGGGRGYDPGSPSQSRLPSASPPYLNGTSSPSSSSTAVNAAIPESDEGDRSPRGEAEDLVDELNREDELYTILGVGKRAKTEEIRRAFLARSRIIHPDKLPFYPPSTTAFQRLSYAYETLSKPSSRRLYDLGGGRGYDPGSPSAASDGLADETLNGVLRNVINEFLNGDFEMIRVFATALNEGNPSLNLGDDTVDSVEGAFRRVREVLLSGQRYLRLIKFELIRLYEIQSSLRALGYFDVYGRLRLTLALTRVTLEIPMVLDRAMRDELPAPAPARGLGAPGRERERDRDRDKKKASANGAAAGAPAGVQEGQLERRGLLGTKTRGMLVLTCKMLERAERWTGSPASAPSAASSSFSAGANGGR